MAEKERVVELITKIAGDPSLRDRLTRSSPEDRAAILAELGYPDVTPADVAANAHHVVATAVEEVDDEQLSSIAGGFDTTDLTTTAGTITTVGAAAAAA
jgi:predicted ribosomally synthesized peptide with nif11-like leader